MVTLSAIAFLAGTYIGLRLDIRMIAAASVLILLAIIGIGVSGQITPEQTVLDAFLLIAALQTGYACIGVLFGMGMIETVETVPVRAITPPSASGNPSRR